MDRRTRIIAASIAALAITGAAGSGIAMAVTGDERSPGPVTVQQAGTERPAAERFLDRLAAELGVEREALDAAIRSSARQLLDEEAAGGSIPPAAADALRRAIASFPDIGGSAGILKEALQDALPRHGRAAGSMEPGTVIARLVESLRSGPADLAAFLGISEADLRTALASGQSLAAIAEANGVSRASLQAYLEGEARARIREAAAAGGLPPVVGALVDSQLPQLIGRLLDAGRP